MQNVERSHGYDPIPTANDLYSVLFGLYFVIALVAVARVIRRGARWLLTRHRQLTHSFSSSSSSSFSSFSSSEHSPCWRLSHHIMRRGLTLIAQSVLMTSAYVMLLVVLPYLIGLLVDAIVFRVAIVTTLSMPLTPYRHFLALQHYLFGLLCFKVWHTLVTSEGVSPHWRRVWQNFQREGYLNGIFLWREVIWPLTRTLLFMLSLPYFVGHAFLPFLGSVHPKHPSHAHTN
jgi:MFS family permease